MLTFCHQFTIDRFSVGNIKVEVDVSNVQPTIALRGELEFPIDEHVENNLRLGLGLTAGIYEARGEA